MRKALPVALALLLPSAALAHGAPPVSFLAPVGPDSVVVRGEPFRVEWYDPNLYPDDTLLLMATSEPPPPYIAFWPVDQIAGEPIAGPVTMDDPANAFELDTSALEAGPWWFWFAVEDPASGSKYVAPNGVLTVIEAGETPAPAIWFDEPWTSTGAVEQSFEVVYSTSSPDVTVTLFGSLNDLEGEALAPIAEGLPGGTRVAHTVSLRCVGDGAYGLFATVQDGEGREGSAWATGRISWRRPVDEPIPEDCFPPEPPGEGPPPGDGGCACSSAATGLPLLPLLLLPLRRKRSSR